MVVSHIQAPDVPDVEDALRALNKSGARQGRALGEKDESDSTLQILLAIWLQALFR